jgi:hypothetical protein
MVKAPWYKPEGRGFDTRGGEWIISICLILGNSKPWGFLESGARPVREADNLTTIYESIV